jgi:signal peptidase I
MSQDTTGRDFMKEVVDFLKDLVIIIAIVLFVRTFLIMPFQINGQSMYDSYYDGEFIIVDRFSYRDVPLLGQHRDVVRGDVVVFKPRVNDERKYFIKRVIGLPGETLKIEGGNVYIKTLNATTFVELDESYLSDANL